jgi:hypothetical protein
MSALQPAIREKLQKVSTATVATCLYKKRIQESIYTRCTTS